LEEELHKKIKELNEAVWGKKTGRDPIKKWLDNFTSESEKLNALFLLSQFIYLSEHQIEQILISLYRDNFKYPIIKKIRERNDDTLDEDIIETEYKKELDQTRFVALGGVSESSAKLLYPFRQLNGLDESLLIYPEKIADSISEEGVKRFVFIDDLAGSGTQANRYLKKIIELAKIKDDEIVFEYLVMICTSTAKNKLEELKLFDRVDAVFNLDESFKVFSEFSRYYEGELDERISKEAFMKCNSQIGEQMLNVTYEKDERIPKDRINEFANRDKLGFKDGQLLIGFQHNTPNNTIPTIWFNDDDYDWFPVFKRHNK
jgi:hypothetical protein